MSTPKQIHANRANATQSTGPKSEAAKTAGSMHALSHGLAATQALLPGEDVKEYEQERRAWFEKYRPDGPDQLDALERAIAATRGLRRCRKHEAVCLTRRAREVRERFDADEQARVRERVAGLPTDPAGAVAGLERSAAGMTYLIERWEFLRDELVVRGVWGPTHLVEALNLLGCRPIDVLGHDRARNAAAPLLRLIIGDPDPGEAAAPDPEAARLRRGEEERVQVLKWFGPVLAAAGQSPPVGWNYALGTLADDLPDSTEEAQAELVEWIDTILEEDRGRLPELEADAELRREESALEAGLLDDSKMGALRLRYMNAHERALQHALRDLERLRKQAAAAEAKALRNKANSAESTSPPTSYVEPIGNLEGIPSGPLSLPEAALVPMAVPAGV